MTHVIDTRTAEGRRFVRHYLEMVAAMVVGMAVFGMLVRLVCALTGQEGVLDHAGARGPIMATNMALGMALWMRHRGHVWGAVTEMAAAMYVPLLVLLIPFWIGALAGAALLGAMHVLMLPAMWLAMLRRRAEYTHDRHEAPAPSRPLAQIR